MSVILPPEMMDKILDNIPTGKEGRRTLITCALVATWWTGPSQRRLFSSVQVYMSNYNRFVNNVLADPKTHLLGFIRSLTYSHRRDYRVQDLEREHGESFSALCNLHSLTLHFIRLEHIGGGRFPTCFSTFRKTLTYLSLHAFTTSFSAFVTLAGYFPNITTLSLDLFMLRPDEVPVPQLSQPLRGKLRVCEVESDCLEFFDRFAELDLEYEELLLDSSRVDVTFMERVLRVSTSTVKFLRFARGLQRE